MTKQKEFKSDTVTFTVERKPECLVEYRVKSTPEIVKKARREAIKSVSKEVSLPGFRKGRAPDHLIVKKFPKPIEEQWQKAIADETFRECQKIAHTPLLSNDAQISFKIEKHSLEEGAEMTYTFETEPEVPEIDLSSIELEEVKREVVDAKKIESTLTDIQMFFSDWGKVSDRPVKEGDYVVVDVDIIETTPPQKALQNARFEVSKKKMAKWMHDLVIGMNIGESKEGVSQADDDASEEEKQKTPPKKVRMVLRSIEQPKLPPIDDALAQKMGAKSADDMKEKLEKLLNKQADEHVKRAYREQINAFLLEKYPFELPRTLLHKETQFRIKQLVSDPASQKKLMAMSEEERKKTAEDVQSQGERAVRLFYLSRKIIQDQKIQVSPSEVHQEVKTPLEAMFSDQSDLYTAKEQSQEQKAIAMSRLVLTKAEDFLISKAKIVPPKPKKKGAPSKKVAEKEDTEKTEQKESPKKGTGAKKKAAPAKKEKQKKKSTKSS
ncbi:MAG: trigger factor [Chlamydiia bacterium]|nr:trigger factor [Chlamydiia bacterium]